MTFFEVLVAAMLVAGSVPMGLLVGGLLIGGVFRFLGLGDKASFYLGGTLGIALCLLMVADVVGGWSRTTGAGSIEELDENRWLRP